MARTTSEDTPQGREIRVDGESYDLDSLSEEAQKQVGNIQIVDGELMRARRQVAILETARGTYVTLLRRELGKD